MGILIVGDRDEGLSVDIYELDTGYSIVRDKDKGLSVDNQMCVHEIGVVRCLLTCFADRKRQGGRPQYEHCGLRA